MTKYTTRKSWKKENPDVYLTAWDSHYKLRPTEERVVAALGKHLQRVEDIPNFFECLYSYDDADDFAEAMMKNQKEIKRINHEMNILKDVYTNKYERAFSDYFEYV